MKKVLVIGSGGREHALAKAFCQSDAVAKVWVAPGNPGMMIDSTCDIECVKIEVDQINELLAFAIENKIDLTFVGPEVPLNHGIVDLFRENQQAIIGPSKNAAQLESSKGFAKDLMQRANVPTASYQRFSEEQVDFAIQFLNTLSAPYVIKDDGLAAGKGVIIAETMEEAKEAIQEMLNTPERQIVIEEYLQGEEFSYFCLVNEQHVIYLGTARDYKRAYDGDRGLNTGGMGAFSPVPFVDSGLEKTVDQQIIRPLLKQMEEEGVPYTGVLYAGLMLTKDGPKVIEFNARFGDPETQILLPRIETDFYQVCLASLEKSQIEVKLSDKHVLGVVLAAKGYPQAYSKGMTIRLSNPKDVSSICFSGVTIQEDEIKANGGRIMMVTAEGENLASSREKVYEDLLLIHCDDSFYRKDIGLSFI